MQLPIKRGYSQRYGQNSFKKQCVRCLWAVGFRGRQISRITGVDASQARKQAITPDKPRGPRSSRRFPQKYKEPCVICLLSVGFSAWRVHKVTGAPALSVYRWGRRRFDPDGYNELSKRQQQSQVRCIAKKPEHYASVHSKVARRYYEKNRNLESFKKRRLQNTRAWLKANRKKANDYRAKQMQKPNFRIAQSVRNRLRDRLKTFGFSKSSKTSELIGCSWVELRLHIEKQFKPGMTWENYGISGWHIDHIKPLASFDLSDQKQLSEACHFTNLQPLWAKDNLAKGAKIDFCQTNDGNAAQVVVSC
jgi:hypothetical protein